jgi:hypothetical protein
VSLLPKSADATLSDTNRSISCFGIMALSLIEYLKKRTPFASHRRGTRAISIGV